MKFLSWIAGLFNKYVRKTSPIPQLLGLCVIAWTLMFTTMPRFGQPDRAFTAIILECIYNVLISLAAFGFVFFVICAAIHFLFYLEKQDWNDKAK